MSAALSGGNRADDEFAVVTLFLFDEDDDEFDEVEEENNELFLFPREFEANSCDDDVEGGDDVTDDDARDFCLLLRRDAFAEF